MTLDLSGRAVWELCDGCHSLDDIADALAEAFFVEKRQMIKDAGQALTRLSQLGFIDGFELKRREKS